jgi:gliding motility-associated-like protein
MYLKPNPAMMNIKGTRSFTIKLLLLIITSVISTIALSEGTKEIRPGAADYGYVVLDPAWSNFGLYGCPATNRLHIRICNAGEKIFYGFRQAQGDVKYRIRNAAGTIVVPESNIPNAGAGFINTHAQALNGPSQIVGGAGYNALSYTAPTTGDYYIEFVLPTGNPRRDFEYFDITVASAANARINGRVWSQSWMFSTRDYGRAFKGKLFIYADDGIVTSLNFNGMDPYVFVLNANQTGTGNTGNAADDRKSKVGSVTYPRYKVFLNNPDEVCFPTGQFGNLTAPTAISGCPGSYCINVFPDRPGTAEVLLNLNGIPGFQAGTTDRILSQDVIPPSTCIPWDTRDGLGNFVTSGSSVDIKTQFYNGLTHIPLYDVERNRNGYIVQLVRPASATVPRLFWDDTNIPAAGGNINLTGCTSPCHTWNWNCCADNGATDYGNRNTINTWWYADSTSRQEVLIFPGGILVDAETRNGNNADNDTIICGSLTNYQLSGRVVNATSGQWSTTGTGTFTPNNTAMNAVYNISAADRTAGFVNLILSSVGNGGCPGIKDTLTLRFQSPPTINAGADVTVCANNAQTTLNGTFTNATGIRWTSSGTGTFSPINTNPNAIYTPSPADTVAGTVTLTISTVGTNRCPVLTDQKIITITDAPIVNPGPSQAVCGNSTISLQGSVTNATSQSWTGGTGTFNPANTALNATYTPSAAERTSGSVTLTLSATGPGCINVTRNVTFTIQPNPTVNAGPDQAVCNNNATVNLAATATNATTYLWSGGAGTFTPNATTLNAIYTATVAERNSGSINLTLTASRPTCTPATDNITITFTNSPVVTAGADTIVCANSNATINLRGTSTTGQGTWTGNGGTFFPSANSLNATYNPSPAEKTLGISSIIFSSTANGTCNPSKDTMKIIYPPAPTAIAGPNQSVCSNKPNVTLAGSVINATSFSWSGGAGTYAPSNTNLNAVYTPTTGEITNGSVSLTLTASKFGCLASTSVMTISFTPTPTVNAGGDQSVCHNNAAVTLAGSQTLATGVLWSGGGGTFNPNSTTANAVYTPTLAERNSGSVLLTLTTTGNGNCNPVSDQVAITITPSPTVDAGTNLTICANKATAVLNATSSTTQGTWTGSGTFTPNASTLNASYAPSAGEITAGSATLTFTSANNGNCLAVSDQMTITISPAPVVNAGTDRSICADNATTTLNGSVTTPATGGTWTGGAGIFNPNRNTLNATYTATVAEINAGTVSLTLTSTGNGICNPVSDQMNITITPAPTVSAGSDQNICGSQTNVTLAGVITGSTGGTWTSSGTGTFTPNANALNATYRASATDKTNGTVTLTLTSTGNGNCLTKTDQMNIIFTPVPSIDAGSNQIVCANDIPVKLNGSGSPAKWTGGNGTFSPNANTLNATYTPTAAELAAKNVELTLTTIANGECPVVSDQVRINLPSAPKAIAGPTQNVCGNTNSISLNGTVQNANGGSWSSTGTGTFFPNPHSAVTTYYTSVLDKVNGTVTFILTTTGNGNCRENSDQSLVIITPVISVNAGPDQTYCADRTSFPLIGSFTGATGIVWTSTGSGTFSPNATTANASYIPSAADKTTGTVTLTLTTTGNGLCPAQNDQVTFTIVPAPTVNAGPDQQICADLDHITLNATSSVASGLEWKTSGTGIFSPGNTVANATYYPSEDDITSGTVTLTVTTTGNGICNSITDQMIVTISPAPTVTTIADQTVCADKASIDIIGSVTVSTGGTWTTNGTGNFTPSANSLNSTYNFTAADKTNGMVTLTLTSTGNGLCKAANEQVIITIAPAPTVNAGADRNVCANNPNVALNGIVTVATGGIWSGGSGTFSPNNTSLNAVYIPSTTEATNGTVTLTLTTTGNGLCNAVTDNVTINIAPSPEVIAGPDQTICSDSIAVTLSGTVTNAGGGVWSSTGSGTFFPNNTNLNAQYSPSATERNNGTVTLTLSSSGNGTCNVVTDKLTITITPSPTIEAGNNQTVCGNNAVITLSGTVTVASGIHWTTSGSGTFTNANSLSTNYTPSAMDINAGTITLTANSTGNGSCKVVSDQVILTITPAPVVNAGPDQTVCANNSAVTLNGQVTRATGGVWTSNGTGTFSPSASTLNATYNPSVADETAGTITLTLTSTGNGLCNEVKDEVKINITPAPAVNAGTDKTVCADIAGVALSGIISNATGALWTTNGTGTFAPNAATLNASYKPSNADTLAKVVVLTLTTTGNGNCLSVNDQVTITIKPTPVVNAGPDETICADVEFVTLTGSVLNATGGSWTSSGSGTFSPDNTTLNGQYFASASDRSSNSITLTLTSTGHGTCQPVTDQKTISFNKVPTVNAGADKTVCANNPNVSLNGSVSIATGGTWVSSGDGTFSPNETTLNASYLPSPNDAASGSVVLTLMTTGNGACNPVSDQVIVTITSAPIVNAGSDQSVCANNSLVNLNGSVSIATGATWSTTGSGTFAPSTSELNATYTPSAADTTAGSVTLTLTSTGNGNCNASTDQMVVNITHSPTVNPGAPQTICANTTGVTLNGSVTVASGGVWSTASGTGTFSPNANALNATFIPSAAQIANGRANLTLTSTGNGNCAVVSANLTITIQPIPFVNAGNDVEICAGTPTIPLNGSVTNASGGSWSGGTGTFIPNNNTLNASYQPSAAENVNGNSVTLTLTSTGNGSCAVETDQVTIKFNTIPVNAGPDQEVCSNSFPVQLSGSGSGSWVGGLGTYSDANALNTSYNPHVSEIGTTVTLTLSTAIGFCSGSDQIRIKINPGPTANAGNDQTLCANNSVVALTGAITNATGSTWTTEGTGVFNNTFTNYTPSAADIASGSVRLSMSTTGNGICKPATDTMVVTFTPAPIVDAGADQAVCANGGPIPIIGSVTGSPNGIWSIVSGSGTIGNVNQLSTIYTASPADTVAKSVLLRLSNTSGTCNTVSDEMRITFGASPTVIAGNDQVICGDATSVALDGKVTIASGGVWNTSGSGYFTPNANALNASYVPSSADTASGVVTLTLLSTGNGTCNAVSDQLQITITNVPTVAVSTQQIICSDLTTTAISGVITTSAGGTWTSSGTGTFANATSLTTSYNPSPSDKLDGTVTLTLTTTGNGTCQAVSATTTITITPAPLVNAGLDQSGCNDVVSYMLNPTVSHSSGIVWSTSGSGSFGNVNTLNTAYNPSAADTTAGSVTLTVTSSGQGTCNPVSDILVITFTDAPIVSAGLDRHICADVDSINLKGAVTVATGGIWSTSGSGTFSPNATALQTAYYFSDADKTSGAVTLTLTSTGNGTCNAKPDQLVIQIDPTPIVNAGQDQTICAGQTNATLNGSVANGGLGTINWTTTGSGTFGSATNANTTYNPSSGDDQLGGIILTLTLSGHATCKDVSDVAVVNIIPSPSAIVNAGFDQTLCQDVASIKLNGLVSNAGGGIWTTTGTGTITPNVNSLDASYILSAADRALPSITISLTTLDNGLCSAVLDDMKISFTPAPTVNANIDQIICGDQAGKAQLAGSFTIATGGIWSSSGTGTFSPDATAKDAIYNPSASDRLNGNVALTLTTTGNGTCNQVQDIMLVRITKIPTINAGPDKTVCTNATAINILAGVTIATGGTWTTSGSGTFGNANALSTTYRPSVADTLSGSILLTVTSSGNNTCTPVKDQLKINFTKAPLINAGPDQTICSGNILTLRGNVTNALGGIWTSNGTGNFSNPNSINTIYTPSQADRTSGTITVALTSVGNGGCTPRSDQSLIVIQAKPVVNPGMPIVCELNKGATLNGIFANSNGVIWASSGSGAFSPNASLGNAIYYPSAEDATAGVVNLTITTTGNGACQAATANTILKIEPLPIAFAGLDQMICRGSSTELTATTSPNVSYNWSSGNNPSISTTPIANVTATTDTSFVLAVTDAKGCVVTDTVKVGVYDLPTFNMTANNCLSDTLILNSNPLNLPVVPGVFQWFRNGDIMTGEDRTILSLTDIGTYSITFSYGNCAVSASTIVTRPPVLKTMKLLDCVNSVADISIISDVPGNYNWPARPGFGGAIGMNLNTISITVPADTNYYKTTVTDAQGCSTSDSVFVIGVPVPALTLDDISSCQLRTELIDGRPDNIANLESFNPTWEWKKDNAMLAETNDSLSVNTTGSYSLILSIGNCKTYDTTDVTFHANPGTDLPEKMKFCKEKDKLIIVDGGAGNAYTYAWTANPNTIILDSNNTRTIAVKDKGLYTVTVTNSNNCNSKDSVYISDVCPPRVFVPNAFTPNNPGPDQTFKVFGDYFINYKMEIFNRWGEVIFISFDRNEGWDGTYLGERMPIGVYPWIVTYEGEDPDLKGPYRLEGTVTIIE